MYECKLLELCQRRSWDLPEYKTVKDGLPHMPLFTASVKVKGQVLETPTQCKSAKKAQNTAARIAFQHFNISPPRRINPQPFSSSASTLDAVIPTLHPVEVADSLPQPSPTSAPTLDGAVIPAVPAANPLPSVSTDTPLPEMERVGAVAPLNIASPLPSSLPLPPPGLLVPKNNAKVKSANGQIPQLDHEVTETSLAYRTPIDSLASSQESPLVENHMKHRDFFPH